MIETYFAIKVIEEIMALVLIIIAIFFTWWLHK